MIPSLVAQHLRRSIVEYLTTTFALSDDETRHALAEFLSDRNEGIFRGPYLRVRTPFRHVDPTWRPPLSWMPDGFSPFVHQARAWERLSSFGHQPEPTIVTTGTGSGKTECFLFPVLDHCIRACAAGQHGIKALILYPMNALATDQARRLAALLTGDELLGGVTAGLFIGDVGRHPQLTPDYLVDDANVLRDNPPDILLTNYKMLDRLLVRADRHGLWAGNEPSTLAYLVLDEFHTYDGAQGTDVAMLLRRLGATLGMAEPGRPLGGCTPVATSATLGTGAGATEELCRFASRVFGVPFGAESVIGEERQTTEEACGPVDFTLPIPDVTEVVEVDENDDDAFDVLATAFTGRTGLSDLELGDLLRGHHLTRVLLNAAGDAPHTWDDVRRAVVGSTPQWGLAAQQAPAAVDMALARFVALLSLARRDDDRPLFPIEVQLWIREVSRLLRAVHPEPRFRWHDSGTIDLGLSAAIRAAEADPGASERESPAAPPTELPAVYCRMCGRAGWMALASELDGSLKHRPRTIYEASAKHSPLLRVMIRASADEDDLRWLGVDDGQLHSSPADDRVPVLVTGADDPTKAEDRARRSECPSCRSDEGIRPLGSAVASLASVSINQLFGMDRRYVESEERKLLAFVGSVQDASHRAAFFSGRTHRFNLRTAMARQVKELGRTSLADLGPDILARAESEGPREVFALVPPDLVRDPAIRTLWSEHPSARGRAMLEARVSLEAHLELGLRSRFGRTLELSGAVVAAVMVDRVEELEELIAEAHAHITGQGALLGMVPGYRPYVLGLLARLRQRGAIFHPWLEPYVAADGEQWHIWGGRPDGMLAFPSGQSRPAFITTGTSKNFDSLQGPSGSATWLLDWAARTLGLDPRQARELNRAAFALLAGAGAVDARTTAQQATVYGLDPHRIEVVDLAEVGEDAAPALLRCGVCVDRLPLPPDHVPDWLGQPCLRFRCPGRYEVAPVDDANYYRHLYRNGEIRRVVTAEHTSLLTRQEREDLEERFKKGDTPDAPNVIAATPTLEMGIDIGDLSAVMLTSVPQSQASYVQRVGRAGRRSGNSLVTTFVRTDPRSLYFLSDPEAMIAGEVRPPNCYLDAIEILRRHWFAFLIDRAADGTLDVPAMPFEIGMVERSGFAADGWLRAILDAGHDLSADHLGRFAALFGGELEPSTVDLLTDYAEIGLDKAVETAFARWRDRRRELERRRDRLADAIRKIEKQPHLTDDDLAEVKRLNGERAGAIGMLRAHRSEYTINALERMGLLPNYTLVDDAAVLTASLWWKDGDKFESSETEYSRNGAVALTEFAPGNSFYVGGHKLVIDALDVGTVNEPLYEPWRLCPECGYGAPEKDAEQLRSCPRCGHATIADAMARHLLLPMRHVYCTASEENARVFDETDERDRAWYDTVTSVDIDPVDVIGAQQHAKVTFGMEFARTATIRTVNFGPSGGPGEKVTVAGREISASRFVACRSCGAVTGARKGYGQDKEFHQGWCQHRNDPNAERKPINLVHELHTEAVRILLPVSTFEVEERLASFKAALLLGLRLDFGGEPEHLAVELSDFPNSGQGRRRFLVLHDRVPGGTGYLGRVADPDRLGRILRRARDFISRCMCRSEGKVACHRCLLGAARPSEMEFVSRDVALELLDALLDDWRFEPVDGGTVAGIALARVDESELERRWKVALRAWAAQPDNPASIEIVPQTGAADALELRLGNDDDSPRYLIREQIEADSIPQTIPDFVITRQDRKATSIAIYLDGFEFHASPAHNNLAFDAAKRQGVRAGGSWVWNLTWDDVKEFHEAVTAAVPRSPAARPVLSTGQRAQAERLHHDRGGTLDLRMIDRNPMQLLLDVLAHPEPDDWERLALSAVGGALAGRADPTPVPEDEIPAVLRALLGGARRATLPGGGGSGADPAAMVFEWETTQGLPILAVLDLGGPGMSSAERWTVIACIPDGDVDVRASGHAGRWRDYLQWANLLQFLSGPGREAVITTASQGRTLDVHDLKVCPVLAGGAGPDTMPDDRMRSEQAHATAGLSSEAQAELALLVDEAAKRLVEAVLEEGAPLFIAGYELADPAVAGAVVEAAWPQERVAVLAAGGGDEEHGLLEWLGQNGWEARPASDWSTAELVGVLHARRENR